MQQQEKQIIEYWFLTSIFSAPVKVQIRMHQRDEAKAKQLFEEMLGTMQCEIIEAPRAGKYLLLNEVWEL